MMWTGLVMWLVPVAAALGAVVRLLCDWHLPVRGVLAANLAGSFLAGAAAAALVGQISPGAPTAADAAPAAQAGLTLLLGFTTALTTFSTVSVRTAELLDQRRWGPAARMWSAHLGGGLLAALAGVVLATVLGL